MIESYSVEFKEVINKTILKEIVAFANSNGGKIYIGITDDGTEVGTINAKESQEKLSSMIRDSIKPSILNYIHVSEQKLKDKDIIIVEIQRGDGKPYYLADKGMRSAGVFKRLGNTSVPVGENDIREMIIENHGTTYENTRSLIQSLSFDYAIKEFKARSINLEIKQMKTLGLFDEDGLYNNLALLFSDQCPHIIKAAIFKGEDKIEFKHRQEFSGSLLKQLDDVYQFLEMQNHMNTSYNGLRRVDEYYYSPIALREGLINSIIHRDYGVGGSIFVNIYSNSCEFVSLGSLPKGIHLEDIYEGVSKPRNERLAQVFYRLELIEAYGTGIMKIMAAYTKSRHTPTIKVTPGAFILRLPVLIETTESDSVYENEGIYAIDSKETMVNLKDRESVLQDILRLIKEKGNITRLEVQQKYRFGQTKSGQLLNELEKNGKIIKKGNGKNSYYILVSR